MGPAPTPTLTLPKRKPKTTTPMVPAMTPSPPKRKPTTRHHFPVASNGKLLDVTIISKQKSQSTIVNLHWQVHEPKPDYNNNNSLFTLLIQIAFCLLILYLFFIATCNSKAK